MNAQSRKVDINSFLISADVRIQNNKQDLIFYGRASNDAEFAAHSIEIHIKNNYPVFFVPRELDTSALQIHHEKNIQLLSENNQKLKALYFANQYDLFKAAQILKQKKEEVFESDVAADERFLMERFIFGGAQVSGMASIFPQKLVFYDPVLKPAHCDTDFSILSLDIETGIRDGKLYSIGLHYTYKNRELAQVILNGQHNIPDPLDQLQIHACASELAMLEKLNEFFIQYDPDIIIGWNVVGFDFSYLIDKARRLGCTLRLGRDHSKPDLIKLKNGNTILKIKGRVVLDGPNVLRAAFYNFKNFKLETVSQAILGSGKQIEKTKNAALEIERLFHHNKADFIRYNIADCQLVSEIFKKTGMIELQKKRSEISGMFLDQTGRSIAAFDYCYLPLLHRRGLVASDAADIDYQNPAIGGYVMDPVTGLHENVMVLDFKSLYPSIIQTFKIDPLSRIQKDIEPLSTPTGFVFSRTSHILPAMITDLLRERQRAKDHQDAHLSMAVKILMNSFYGVMGSSACRFYHPDLPVAITSTGQWLLKQSRTYLQAAGFKVIYGDTDSLFITTTNSNRAESHDAGQEAARMLTEYWQKRLHAEYDLQSFLEMEYEKLYTKFFLPMARGGGGAKKRYAGLLKTRAGEKLCFTGMESVRTDWSDLAKNFQYDLFEKYFHNQEIETWIREFIKNVKAGQMDHLLTISKKLRKPIHEYTANMPQHVKAAKMLNRPVRQVSYKMTPEGPIPIELNPQKFDYNYYVEHQIRPIAETLLPVLHLSFEDLSGPRQLKLFS